MKLLFLFSIIVRTASIIIDPGHGGKDSGVISEGLAEKEFTLQLAEALRNEVAEFAEVFLTREGDYSLSQVERVEYANGKRGDLFISLHINTSFSESLSGTAIYIPSTPSRNCQSHELIGWEEVAGCHKDRTEVLARCISEELKGFRQIKVERINSYILTGLNMPGVVVEVGFAKGDRERLLSPFWRSEFVKLLGYGIRRFIDENRKEER